MDKVENNKKDLNIDQNINTPNPVDGLYKRLERLVAAVFLVSNNISGDDELKLKIKDLSLKLMTDLLSVRNFDFHSIEKSLLGIESISMEIVSLFKIASISGIVSNMNSEIIINEFNVFIKEIKDLEDKMSLARELPLKNILTSGDNNKIKIGGESIPISGAMAPEYGIYYKGQVGKNSGLLRAIGGRKDTRKTIILSFISKNPEAGIKDILPNIKGCSEKTVQRELIELIEEGKIIKTGERRWSRYSVADLSIKV